MRSAEPAVMEDEPDAFFAAAGLDRPDEQHVIAGSMPRVVAALEPGDTASEQRHARGAQPIVDAGEAIGVRTRKSPRQVGLVVRKHIDRVMRGALECGEARRAAVQAPHDERRVERHRVERVCREAHETVIGAGRADDRNARRELREGVAKLPISERGNAAGVATAGGGRSQCVATDKAPMVAAPGACGKMPLRATGSENVNWRTMLVN